MSISCGRVRGNPPLTKDDLIDSAWRHTNVSSQLILTELHQFKKLKEQNFSRMDRIKLSAIHNLSSVVVNDLNVEGVAILPPETDRPLIVDANAVNSLSFTSELLKTMSGRDA